MFWFYPGNFFCVYHFSSMFDMMWVISIQIKITYWLGTLATVITIIFIIIIIIIIIIIFLLSLLLILLSIPILLTLFWYLWILANQLLKTVT